MDDLSDEEPCFEREGQYETDDVLGRLQTKQLVYSNIKKLNKKLNKWESIGFYVYFDLNRCVTWFELIPFLTLFEFKDKTKVVKMFPPDWFRKVKSFNDCDLENLVKSGTLDRDTVFARSFAINAIVSLIQSDHIHTLHAKVQEHIFGPSEDKMSELNNNARKMLLAMVEGNKRETDKNTAQLESLRAGLQEIAISNKRICSLLQT